MSVLLPLSAPYIVIQSTRAPYSSSAAVDCFEAALAATNIGLQVVFIFVEDGVLQLMQTQQNGLIQHKSIFKRLSALPLFDIEILYAQASALSTREVTLDQLELNVSAISDAAIYALCEKAQQILVF